MIDRDSAAPLATGSIDAAAAVAVSTHHLASQAAIDVIGAGGNAVDAAVAANAVVGVLLPDTCGIGGDLFAIVHTPGEAAPSALNASGRAGSGASSSRLREAGHTSVPLRCVESITIPGCVDGWEALVRRYGSRTLAEDLEHAVGYATEGFAVSDELAESLERLEPLIGDQPSAGALYPEGRAPLPGATITRPGLAATLSAIATDGREAFYAGAAGNAIMEVTGGMITSSDLERIQAEWVEPLGAGIMGLTAWTIPPNSQGWLTLATLRIFELIDPPRDPLDPGYHHALIEAYRSVVWERADTTCDPDTMPVDPMSLLDDTRLMLRAGQIDTERVAGWPTATNAPGGTTYLATRDHSGMAVSLIQSNYRGIGTGLSAGTTGVWLHDRGEGFDLRPGHPNELMPGRRPLHTLAPTLWTRADKTAVVLGTRGGDQQPQLLAQIAAHHLWADLVAEDAQAQPRWTIADIADPDPTVMIESRLAPGTADGLVARGHAVEAADAWETGWGPVSLITEGPDLRGAADPRVSTTAAIAGE
jgi:gamma-glutamyltranspeptidase / glutathione hydrolase